MLEISDSAEAAEAALKACPQACREAAELALKAKEVLEEAEEALRLWVESGPVSQADQVREEAREALEKALSALLDEARAAEGQAALERVAEVYDRAQEAYRGTEARVYRASMGLERLYNQPIRLAHQIRNAERRRDRALEAHAEARDSRVEAFSALLDEAKAAEGRAAPKRAVEIYEEAVEAHEEAKGAYREAEETYDRDDEMQAHEAVLRLSIQQANEALGQASEAVWTTFIPKARNRITDEVELIPACELPDDL